jgi:hypothetical protein
MAVLARQKALQLRAENKAGQTKSVDMFCSVPKDTLIAMQSCVSHSIHLDYMRLQVDVELHRAGSEGLVVVSFSGEGRSDAAAGYADKPCIVYFGTLQLGALICTCTAPRHYPDLGRGAILCA